MKRKGIVKTVNDTYLYYLLQPLSGSADEDRYYRRKYPKYDPNDARDITSMIQKELYPYFQSWCEASKQGAKLCLRYYLTVYDQEPDRRREVDGVFDVWLSSMLVFFPSPSAPRNFFALLWAVLCGNEDYTLSDYKEYTVVNEADDMVGRDFSGG